MDIAVSGKPPQQEKSPALVVGCCEDWPTVPGWFEQLDRPLNGLLSALVAGPEQGGKRGKARLVPTLGRIGAERVLLVGLGKHGELDVEVLREGAGNAAQLLRQAGIEQCSSILHLNQEKLPEAVSAVVDGTVLGGYQFDLYKTTAGVEKPLQRLTIPGVPASEQEHCREAAAESRAICAAVALARDLVSQPGNVVTPSFLADQALNIAASRGISCRVLEREEMEKLGMAAHLAVAKGAHQPPVFILLEYRGGGSARPIVLVGKGITFDAGGISLKPRDGMEKMKTDMAGAAAVIGTVQAVADLGLPVNLVALVPAAENLPGGGAYKPGDVLRTMSGKTIEVVNTDAEGRLLLCDALHYAQRFKPAVLIDLATLTGACVVALGHHATGLMGNDARLKRALQAAGERSRERLWELPLWEEYGELMKSDIADMKNAGGPTAGAISAGWFLQQFAGKIRWAHLDIAGTAWEEKGRPYVPKGASGVGVRLLVEYLKGAC